MTKVDFAALASIALAASFGSSAWASRVPSDTPDIVSPTFCHDLASVCTPSNVAALTGDIDTAWANNIYIYDEGIVSLNGPLPAGASLSDRSTLGASFLAPGLIQSGSYSVTAYCGGSFEGGFGSCASNQIEILFGSGTTLFGLGITDNGPANATTISKISVTFDYGATGPFPADTENMPTANLPGGAIIGYNIGGSKLWTLAPGDPGADDRYNGSFDVSMPGAPFGVPEPDSWLLMLTGLGVVGVSLRARSKATAETI